MMFGITTALDLCRDQTLGQCVSHYTAGSAFLGYALLMMVLVQTGGAALGGRAWGVGREMMDGVFMAVAVRIAATDRGQGCGLVGWMRGS